MRLPALLPAWMLAVMPLVWPPPAAAVIKVEFPVSKIYQASEAVAVGTIARVSTENRLLVVRVAETLKGKPVGASGRLRIQIVAPAELIKKVAADRCVVVFVGKATSGPVAVLHLADTWLFAKGIPNAQPPLWRVVQTYNAAQSFPGRTVALARLVRELKAGRPGLLNKIEHNVFRGDPRELGTIMPNAACLLAADVNGDGKDDVLVGSARGVRLLLAGKSGMVEATAKWGLSGARGAWAAFGDVNNDKKLDLLLGNSLWINDGATFGRQKRILDLPAKPAPLAVTLHDVSGDRAADAVILSRDGGLLVFQNPGNLGGEWRKHPSRKLWTDGQAPVAASFAPDWGDTGELHLMVVRPRGLTRYAVGPKPNPPADFRRLTGVDMGRYGKAKRPRDDWKAIAAAAIDINGDGRLDYLVWTTGPRGGPMLVNRGAGTFLINPDASGRTLSRGRWKVPWKQVTPDTLVAAGDIHGDKFEDLLIATQAGKLFELSNPPFPRPR